MGGLLPAVDQCSSESAAGATGSGRTAAGLTQGARYSPNPAQRRNGAIMAYDLKITGGTIIDGSGNPRYRGDVGIGGGKVVALGSARETIDAAARVVAPGFVDIHTHYDAQILWDRMLSISPWHGVTTVVMGNCGFGVAPTRPTHRDLIVRTLEKVEGMSVAALQAGMGEEWGFETFPQYLDAIARRGSAINVG